MHLPQMPVMRAALTQRQEQMLFLEESSLCLSLLPLRLQVSVLG